MCAFNESRCRGIIKDAIKHLIDISAVESVESNRFPFREAQEAARNKTGISNVSSSSDIDDMFCPTVVANASHDAYLASREFVSTTRDLIQEYDRARELAHESGEASKLTYSLHRRLESMYSEDARYAHLIAADLSKRHFFQRGDITSILNRKDNQYLNPMICAGRQFCVTAEGRMGLVPAFSAVGDIVAVISNSPTPHILRLCMNVNSGDRSNKSRSHPKKRSHCSSKSNCKLVGECYAHGNMDGEEPSGPSSLSLETFKII